MRNHSEVLVNFHHNPVTLVSLRGILGALCWLKMARTHIIINSSCCNIVFVWERARKREREMQVLSNIPGHEPQQVVIIESFSFATISIADKTLLLHTGGHYYIKKNVGRSSVSQIVLHSHLSPCNGLKTVYTCCILLKKCIIFQLKQHILFVTKQQHNINVTLRQ